MVSAEVAMELALAMILSQTQHSPLDSLKATTAPKNST
jgi:hypothetical protein